MKKELPFLNLICIIIAVGFLAAAVLNLISTSFEISTDNLFVTMVCMVMALVFIVNPLLYLKSEGRLPIPFVKGTAPTPQLSTASPAPAARVPAASTPALLDAKGRAVPPDVKTIMAKMAQTESKEA
jgi:hypothetical protein